MSSTPLIRIALLLAVLIAASRSEAVLVAVDYRMVWPAAPGQPVNLNVGGPHWTGVVDTVGDTLTIYTWEELPITTDWWSPLWTPEIQSSGLVWKAVDASGGDFNVPDDFADVFANPQLNTTFGFVSEVAAKDMLWKDIRGVPQQLQLAPGLDVFPGWGAVGYDFGSGKFFDVSSNHQVMPQLPYGQAALADTFGAFVTASVISPEVGSVPESSALALGAVVVGLAATWVGGRTLVARRLQRPSTAS